MSNININALQNATSQPVPAPQHENPITYNTAFDTSTDEYGAPIVPAQHQPSPQPTPQDPFQQLLNQQNPANPQQPADQPVNMAMISQLLNPDVTEITTPTDPTQPAPAPQQDLSSVFEQLAQTITAANQAPQTGPDGQPVNPITAVFSEAYGEDIDFAAMMAEDGDPATINTAMQQSVRSKMEAVYSGAITQSLALSQQLMDRRFNEFTEQQTARTSQATAQSTLNTQLPFTTKPEYSGLAQMLLTQAMTKTKNNVGQSVQLVEQLFRLSNPALFANNNSTRFGSPQPAQSSGPTPLTLDTMANFLN